MLIDTDKPAWTYEYVNGTFPELKTFTCVIL